MSLISLVILIFLFVVRGAVVKIAFVGMNTILLSSCITEYINADLENIVTEVVEPELL